METSEGCNRYCLMCLLFLLIQFLLKTSSKSSFQLNNNKMFAKTSLRNTIQVQRWNKRKFNLSLRGKIRRGCQLNLKILSRFTTNSSPLKSISSTMAANYQKLLLTNFSNKLLSSPTRFTIKVQTNLGSAFL